MSEIAPAPEANNIIVLLNRVMEEVKVIGKNERPSGGPQFQYRGVDTVVDAVGPALRKHGVICLPALQHIECSPRGKEFNVVVQVLYTFYGPAGDSVTALVAGEAMDNRDKATTQAQSVAYRELFLKALCIPSGDPDPDEYRAPAPEQAQQAAPVADTPDTVAIRYGWPDAAKQQKFYDQLITLTDPIPDVMVAPITAWMLENEISPKTFTPAQAKAWKALVDEATATPAT